MYALTLRFELYAYKAAAYFMTTLFDDPAILAMAFC